MKQLLLSIFLLTASISLYAQVGIGTTTPNAFFNVATGKDVLFGEDLTSTGYKLIWYAGQGGLRAGYVDNASWNSTNVGPFSLAAGYNTKATQQAAISLGASTTASGIASLATGNGSTASGSAATALGLQTTASGDNTTATGYQTIASGQGAVSMGNSTTALGEVSTTLGYQSLAIGTGAIASGYKTVASGSYATAMGYNTTASGDYGMALGAYVSTNSQLGSFILGGYVDGYTYKNSQPSQMMMRFKGGYILYSSSPASQSTAVGVQLAPNGNAWQTLSDSTRKENFRSVDGAYFLQKISDMRLSSWNYKGQDAKQYRHYGPMAQEFFAAFGHDDLGIIGEDKSINQADFDGVNLIAIQALIKENQALKARLEAFEKKEKTTQARLDQIETLLENQAAVKIVTFKP